MHPQLQNINKLMQECLKMPKERKKTFFKKMSNVFLSIMFLVLSLLVVGSFREKEIIISNSENSSKKIINLGQLGSIIPSNIKNKDRVNFLFLGMAGENNPAPTLTDTIIILNSGPKAENPVGISIPRDLLVKFPDKNFYTKINAIYQFGGIEILKSKIKEITGLEIDYWAILDLEAVKNIINEINGINVFVKEDIYDPAFPAPYNSYEIFSLKKGEQHLDGEIALKYLRSRNQKEGDFARIERQQQVINVLKEKVLSLNLLKDFGVLFKIWKTLDSHSQTNLNLSDIKYAWNLAKKTNLDEIKFITINNSEENGLLVSGQEILSGKIGYVLKPKQGVNNYTKIKEYINQLIKNL